MASMVDTAITMDEDTRLKKREDYARLLVQVSPADIDKALIIMKDPTGKTYQQKVWFEWVPWVCSKCLKFGHEDRKCKAPKTVIPEAAVLPSEEGETCEKDVQINSLLPVLENQQPPDISTSSVEEAATSTSGNPS